MAQSAANQSAPPETLPQASAGQMRARVEAQRRRRLENPGRIGVKVNLYRGYELESAAAAANAAALHSSPIECFMVGDSYFMTHLGRATTRLEATEWDWALDVMVSLLRECRAALERTYPSRDRPYLLGDFPDGATRTTADALHAAGRLMDAGAEAVKIEIGAETEFAIMEALASEGFPIVVHLGYAPQRRALRRYGSTFEEINELCQAARRARDLGAIALVLEMVTETANRVLCRPHPRSLAVHSIFSGRADLGGQSLNVWDAVFRPDRASKYFPPTATLDRATERDQYGPATIVPAMARLLRMTVDGEFPLSPPEPDLLAEILDPWGRGARVREAAQATGDHHA